MISRMLLVALLCPFIVPLQAHAQQKIDPASGLPKSVKAKPAQVMSAEDRINVALDSETSFDLFEQPLTDLIEFLRSKHGINAQLDVPGLDLAGVSPEDQVTRALSGISLRSGLRLTLRDMDLTYQIRDEVLQITSTEAAGNALSTKIHDVTDLVSKMAAEDADKQILELVAAFVSPESWSESGGRGEIKVVSFGDEKVLLLVSQQTTIHEDISELLASLRNSIE